MSNNRTCPQCQQPLPTDAPEGLCPACVLQNLAVSQPGEPTQILPKGGKPEPVIDIADPAEVAKRLPQFEIIELLGRGGMGVVYKARQVQLDRVVALKILPPEDALLPDFVARFMREARSLAKLNHPNIVTVYEFGESGGLYYLLMEFVDGANLRQLMQSKKLTADKALAIVPKVCDALEYAHEEGVVHRDIKPENILMDKKGRVKIADFGLAKLLRREALDMTLTLAGTTLGTLRYMAPEQMDKPESVDHRADIYSLGVVFYEMLTGETPVGRFLLPSQKAQVDARLDEIVLHALEKEPERRYQHASEVKTDVENVTGDPHGTSGPAAATDKPTGSHTLTTHAIMAVAWTAILALAMYKLQTAWPMVALFFFKLWDESDLRDDNVKQWSRAIWMVCVVGLSAYGVVISGTFWPIIGLLLLFNKGSSAEDAEKEEREMEEFTQYLNKLAEERKARSKQRRPLVFTVWAVLGCLAAASSALLTWHIVGTLAHEVSGYDVLQGKLTLIGGVAMALLFIVTHSGRAGAVWRPALLCGQAIVLLGVCGWEFSAIAEGGTRSKTWEREGFYKSVTVTAMGQTYNDDGAGTAASRVGSADHVTIEHVELKVGWGPYVLGGIALALALFSAVQVRLALNARASEADAALVP